MQYLKDAVAQVDARIEQLQMVRKVLTGLDGYVATKPWPRKPWAKAGSRKVSRGREISKAGIERIRAAQKARWARYHAQQKAKGKK